MNDEIEGLREIVRGSLPKIKQSACFLSLFTPDFEKDPVPVLQLGLAILMDKPIAVLATDGRKVPEALRRIAAAVEVVEPGASLAEMQAATTRLLEKMPVGAGGSQ